MIKLIMEHYPVARWEPKSYNWPARTLLFKVYAGEYSIGLFMRAVNPLETKGKPSFVDRKRGKLCAPSFLAA